MTHNDVITDMNDIAGTLSTVVIMVVVGAGFVYWLRLAGAVNV